MNKLDRRLAIVIALQQRQETASSLAEKLEVSRRTILRDIEALSEIGIPVYAVAGPKGGLRLMEEYKMPPLSFNSAEALTLLISLNALVKMADTPFNQARWTAMDKLRAALPAPILQQAEALLGRVEIDMPSRRFKAPFLERLLHGAESFDWLHVHYRSERQVRWLRLLPRKVYAAYGFWYCEAYSAEHGEQRTFRVDRFLDMKPLEQSLKAELNASVLEAESGSEQEVESGEESAAVRIKAKLTYRGALLAEQDPHIGEAVRHTANEEWMLVFDCPPSEWHWAVKFFFSLGMDAQVLEPQRLRLELFRLASELCSSYAPDSKEEQQ